MCYRFRVLKVTAIRETDGGNGVREAGLVGWEAAEIWLTMREGIVNGSDKQGFQCRGDIGILNPFSSVRDIFVIEGEACWEVSIQLLKTFEDGGGNVLFHGFRDQQAQRPLLGRS